MHESILKVLAPSSQNNVRQIVKSALEKYVENRSEWWARMIEDITGSYPDYMPPEDEIKSDNEHQI